MHVIILLGAIAAFGWAVDEYRKTHVSQQPSASDGEQPQSVSDTSLDVSTNPSPIVTDFNYAFEPATSNDVIDSSVVLSGGSDVAPPVKIRDVK